MKQAPLQLPPSFKSRIIKTFGDQGRDWLHSLANTIKECAEHFELTIGNTFPDMSYNYVATATRKCGQHVVIKIGVPNKELANEITALQLMQGNAMVQLLEHDTKKGIMILEKLDPGHTLATISDDKKATEIAAGIIQKLWRPIPEKHNFPSTTQWCADLKRTITKSVPIKLVDRAIKISDELHQSMGEAVLLHSDLHHFNILESKCEKWLAIDPKGVIGEREYEVAALFRNPVPNIITTMNTKKLLANRIDQLSDLLNFDKHRVLGWGYSLSVLAAIWCHDDNWRYFMKCAEALYDITS